ncbi:MAG TPA: hypothetical protein GXX26_01500 [Clostridiaceae bacterium]|nr:hypothetical protein [Clostridiaceae bacterium]HOJ81321.1 hypothetical protein [Clostridiales bacterium]
MRKSNFEAEIYRLVILAALVAIIGDIIDLIIACKQYCYALKGKTDDAIEIEPFIL